MDDTTNRESVAVPRRVVMRGLWVGSLLWFAHDLSRLLGSPGLRVSAKNGVTLDSPFEHQLLTPRLVVMVGEPAVCDVVTLLREPRIPVSYTDGHSVTLRGNDGLSVARVPRRSQFSSDEYQGNSVSGGVLPGTSHSGSRFTFALNHAYAITDPGEYVADVTFDMPWRVSTPTDRQQWDDFHRQIAQPQQGGKMPPFPKQTSPEYPHQATLQIAITCTPADTQKLQESARRACRELISLYFTKPNTWFFDRRRAVEAFWCYPDDILLPIAKSELLPVKQRFREYAAVPSTGDNSLHGEVVVTQSLLSDLVSANNCPPLSPARDAFVHWLADDALSGKNTALRAFVQSTLDNAPRPA